MNTVTGGGLGGGRSIDVNANVSSRSLLQEALPEPANGQGLLTSAGNSNVLVVSTVVLPPGSGRAVSEGSLGPHTPHVIQPDGAGAPAEAAGSRVWLPRSTAAQLPADHSRVPQVPAVVTHGPPAPTVPHLQPA